VLLSAPERRFAFENKELLTDWLRDDLGFEGYVMSDRGATHSTAPAIKAGLDLEFASPRWSALS
jgi:beta-glucosidase